MDFNNFNNYITITNEELPLTDFKLFKVNKIEFQIKTPKKDFKFQNISDFFIEANCTLLENTKTNKGENLKNEKLLGFINNIRIDLKEVLEYTLDNSELNVLFYEDFIGDSILSSSAISFNLKPYFHLNFAYIYKESEAFLNVSLVYTLYLK